MPAAIPVYRRTRRSPARPDFPAVTFRPEGAEFLGTIRAPDGVAVTTSRRGGGLTLAVPGVAVRLLAAEAVAAAKRGTFGLAWEPADPAEEC